jgi:cell division protein FtsQ
MPVTAPADRRFLRAQVKPGRRHSPWRVRLRAAGRVLVAMALLAAAWRAGVMLGGSRLLLVSRVVVAGNQRLSTGEVLGLLDGLAGRSILAVDLEEWRRRVLACPWVADATLRRWLPSTIEVTVTERYPIAIGRFGEELYLVDDRGAMIDEYGPRYNDLDLPILDGLGKPPGRQPDLDERRARLAARLLADLRTKPDVARLVSQVDVSDPHDAVVIVAGDTARLRLGEERFLERIQSYFDLARTIRESVPEIDYVDLRFGERVFVGAQAPAASVSATAGRRAPGVSNP